MQVCYRHALALDILGGKQPLLGWALHGLQAGVDSILQVSDGEDSHLRSSVWLPEWAVCAEYGLPLSCGAVAAQAAAFVMCRETINEMR